MFVTETDMSPSLKKKSPKSLQKSKTKIMDKKPAYFKLSKKLTQMLLGDRLLTMKPKEDLGPYAMQFDFSPDLIMQQMSKDMLKTLKKVWMEFEDGIDLKEFIKLLVKHIGVADEA